MLHVSTGGGGQEFHCAATGLLPLAVCLSEITSLAVRASLSEVAGTLICPLVCLAGSCRGEALGDVPVSTVQAACGPCRSSQATERLCVWALGSPFQYLRLPCAPTQGFFLAS